MALLGREFGGDSISRNRELLAAVHPRSTQARPNVGWVGKMASTLGIEITVLCTEGSAERFQRGRLGFIVRPRQFRGRIVVATCCLAEWGRIVQPGARNERFWRAYALMPVYECTGDGHSNQGLPDDAGLLGQLRAESERLREQWPANANANGGLATGEAERLVTDVRGPERSSRRSRVVNDTRCSSCWTRRMVQWLGGRPQDG